MGKSVACKAVDASVVYAAPKTFALTTEQQRERELLSVQSRALAEPLMRLRGGKGARDLWLIRPKSL